MLSLSISINKQMPFHWNCQHQMLQFLLRRWMTRVEKQPKNQAPSLLQNVTDVRVLHFHFFHQPSPEGVTAEQKLQQVRFLGITSQEACHFGTHNWTWLNKAQLISNCRTVTAKSCMTPGNHGSIFQNRRKGRVWGLNLLHTLELISNSELSPPEAARPQLTTDPSSRIAAKAAFVAWIFCTPFSWSGTAELSPPKHGFPQVTLDPSSKIAAKAESVAWIRCTSFSWSRIAQRSPATSGEPQVTTDPSSRIAAKTPPAAWICWNCRTVTAIGWFPPSHDTGQYTKTECERFWCIAELSPPKSASPQVKIAPSPWHHEAKALSVAASCVWSTRAVRHSPSSISASSKACSKSTRTRFLAVISQIFTKGSLGLCPYVLNRGRRQKWQKFSMPMRQSYIYLNHFRRPPNMTTLQNINNAQVSSRDSCQWISTGHLSQQLRKFSEFPPNKRAQNHPFSREGRPSFLDSKIAVKAESVAWIRCTSFSWSRIAQRSPPTSGEPQVTTDPSSRIAAKTPPAAWICCTPLSCSRTAEVSPPLSDFPPSHDTGQYTKTKCERGSQGPPRSGPLLVHCRTVAAKVCITPGKDCTVSMTPRGKGTFCCCQLCLEYESCKALSVLYLCLF